MRFDPRHTGLRNLIALAAIQGSNALVPLLIVPYAIATLGTAAYAEVAITEAVSAIALAAVLFSFDVDGVARIAQNGGSKDRGELGVVLSAVISARLVLFIAVAPLLLAAYWLVGGRSVGLLALWLLVPLGQVFHSYWFYQAIESNAPPAIITLLSRVATIVLVLLTVRGPQDAALVPLSIGAPFVIGGLISTLYLVWSMGLRLRWAGLSAVVGDLRHGKEVFAGNAAVTLYREINVVILGIVGAPAASIAAYSLVEKAVKMLQAVTRPLSQLFFPKVLRALSGCDEPNRSVARLIARFTLPQIGVALVLLTLTPIVYAIGASQFDQVRQFGELPQVKAMAAIMAPAILFGLANSMYGTAGLNMLNNRRYFFLAILATGVSSALFAFVLSMSLGAMGAAIAFLGAEAMLFALVLARYIRRRSENAS